MPICVNYTGSDFSTGSITIDGIPKGVGLNLGNALRRTLLSELEGAAVTAVRINGALHEFDCIDGVKEDVTEIIRNLRKLDLRLDGDGGVAARIATNQREVKALDIQTDGSLEVLNPDLHIATLNPGVSLHMEIEIEKGRGFRHAKENLKLGYPENTIPVASDFSPVRRVGYSIEQIDGETEKLVIQIETNGSLTPQDAALQAMDLLTSWLKANILISHSNYNGDAGEFHLDETASHNLGSVLKRALLAYEFGGNRPVLAVELRNSSMKVRTDGTMNPKSALESAASGLREKFAELRKAIADCERASEQPPMSPFDKGDYATQMQAQPIVFGDTAFAEEAPDLLAIQLDSYNKFISEGLTSALSEAFPITDARGEFELELVGHRLEKPALDADECMLYLKTYSAPLWLSLRLNVKENGSTKEGEICMGEIPLMTERGTFVINGVERVVVSQLHRSPGAFFTEETDRSGKKLHTARIVPYRGAWLELESDPEGRINARIDRRKRIYATVLLRALGWETDEEILSLFDGMAEEETEPIRKTLEDDVIKTENDALMEILKLFHIEPELDIESARSRFQRFFFDPARYDLFRVGRAMLNRRLGTDVPEDETILRKEDVVETLKYLLKLIHGEKKPDDMEHLGNRRVRSVEELLQIQLLIGLSRIARTAKESLAVQDLENATIQDIIHPGSLAGSIEEFFESSELSQVIQQTNPLDELTHARRLSLLGPGGVHQDRASIEVRDVHHSHSGRICPIETPEGPNVGLILSLANHARVDEYGFLETPYRKVEKTDLVEYLAADKTDGRVIADSVKPSVACRDGQMIEAGEPDVDYVALYPQQILGTSASLIPLIEHNDPNRALMGANMQRQAVPLLHPEAPLVQTGMERKAAVDSRAVVRARGNGKVKKATSREIMIAYADGKCEIYRLVKHRRSNGSHQMDQRPVVSAGQSVHRGQIIADCQSSENGVLSLGRNVLIAYMPWEGYNFEGGIVISDRLVKDDVFTSVSIESFRVEARDTEHGVEYFTRDVPDKEKFWQLEENGIVKEGKWVKSGDVLVGKLTPVSDMRLETGDLRRETSDVRLETGDKSREVRYEDASQVVPPYVEGQVIRAIHLSRKRGDDLPAGVEEAAIVHVAVRREVKAGDKFAGRHGNKGVVAKIVPEEDMPFLPDGTPIQMILNPLGIPARMNLGQILETHLGWAASKLGGPVISPPYDGASNEDIRNLLQRANLPEDGMITLFDGRDGRAFDMEVTVGYQYQMKLYHQVDDKIHARASGPYSILTGQPLGGRSQFGGQRCGEMEVWALQAYGAAHTLHEMMTLKAISTAGVRTYEALAKGEEVHSTDYEGNTPSFKLLTDWMRGLCIDMTKDEEGVKVRLASPEEIRGWSEGEVDVRLADGVTEGDRGDEKDTVLDELPNPDAMGHIELAAPVSHIWFLKGLPSRIGLAIYVAFRELEKVIYYESYVVLDSASDALSVGQILTPQEYEESKDKHEFRAGIGAGAIRELLERIDFDAAISEIRAQMEVTDAKEIVRKLKKRLVLIQSLQRAGLRPEWMVTDVIPVVPYNVRPNVPLQEGEYATADLNTLYKRVIIRNNRLKRLMELKAPEAVIHNEKRALQDAVDVLFDNGRHGRVARDESNRVLKSLSDLLKGKAGIFRGSLLGSRVDYSGRSVIVPGPELKLGECGLPIEMALILFEPFVIRLMRKTGRARTIMSAMRAVRQKHPEAVETLREVIADKLVLLNRAPTLHRASVQAFRPVLVDDRAMHLHPLVCYAFNADFDGDQMAVHVPVTPEAQKEARELMLSHRNILSPMTGRLLARPSMDLILGCHYLTLSQDAGNTGGANPFSYDEIKRAYELGEVGLHEEIQLNVRDEVMETTVGRAIFNDILEEKLPFVNETLDADRIFDLVEKMYREHGEEEAVALLDRLKGLGFKFATRSGISISELRLETSDFRFSSPKSLVSSLRSQVSGLTSEDQYRNGLSQLEYFTLTHGARMRLANTALKVESSGYLTRKLAVVASDVVVTEEDCGTQKPRNVVNCETLYGVCAKCYGTDLSTGQPVKPGTPVGIIAATAIGAPLVQLPVSPSTAIPKLTQLFEARRDAGEALFEVDGESFRSPSELLQAKGVEFLHKHLLKAMMDVYHSHGIEIDAKHFEVIIRQMLSPVIITDPGDTDFYVEQEVSRERLLLENARTAESGGRPASSERIIRGITKAALTGDSFLVAASFQQTTNVLTRAVLRGQTDPLRGMRECVIVGKLMPVGTGFSD